MFMSGISIMFHVTVMLSETVRCCRCRFASCARINTSNTRVVAYMVVML